MRRGRGNSRVSGAGFLTDGYKCATTCGKWQAGLRLSCAADSPDTCSNMDRKERDVSYAWLRSVHDRSERVLHSGMEENDHWLAGGTEIGNETRKGLGAGGAFLHRQPPVCPGPPVPSGF